MKRKKSKNEFPQRVFALYLLFSFLGMTSVIAGVCTVFYTGKAQRGAEQRKGLFLTHHSKAAIALQKKEYDRLQELCHQVSLEPEVGSCSVYSLDGQCLAHSDKTLIGTDRVFHAGNVKLEDGIEMLQIAESQLQAVEYSSPLGRKNIAGTLVVTFEKGQPWMTMSEFGPMVIFVFCIPLSVILIGGIILKKRISDLGQVHDQLIEFAAQPSLAMAEFKPVPSRNAVSHGWNAMVKELGAVEERPALHDRLLGVVRTRRNDRHESAVDSLPDGIAETDIDGQITFINNAMAALLGESEKEKLLGMNIEEFLDVDSQDEKLQVPLKELLDEKTQARPMIAELKRTSNAGERVLRVGKFPIAPKPNDPRAGQAWSVRDVTQQKMAERARDEFLDSATHELRTPLANIKAYAETLSLSEMSDIEQQKEFCNIINSEATRLARFIDELLDVSSIEAGSLHATMQRVEVDRLLEDVVAKVRPLMKQKEIELEIVFGEKLPELTLDKEKFSTCLVNLLGNAAKYTQMGGHVSFKAQVNQGQLYISVSDNGIGIAEDDLPKIFDKFFRSDDDRVHAEVGTGLGLAFVNEVAKLHDAKLSVESQVNEGTTFTLQMNIPKDVKYV